MSRVHARYTTPGGRTVTVVVGLPLLRAGWQCDGCWHSTDSIDSVADHDAAARSHAPRCPGRGSGASYRHKPAYWGLI